MSESNCEKHRKCTVVHTHGNNGHIEWNNIRIYDECDQLILKITRDGIKRILV